MDTSKNGTITRLTWCAANLLSDYVLDALPALCALEVGQAYYAGRYEWRVKAQLAACGNELEEINAIREWAETLGAVLLLDDAHVSPSSGAGYRNLSALYRLDDGVLFEVWTHIAVTAPEPVAA